MTAIAPRFTSRPTPLPSPLTIELVTTQERLLELRDEWNALSARAWPSAFATFGWTWAWWRSFGAVEARTVHSAPWILVARRGERLAGVLPLVRRTTRWPILRFRRLEWGDQGFTDYMDPALDDGAERQVVLTAMLRHLAEHRAEWDLLSWRRSHVHAGLVPVLERAARAAGLSCRVFDDEEYLAVRVRGGWNDVVATRSARSRQTMGRMIRRIEDDGVRGRVIERPDRDPGLLGRMAQLELKRRPTGSVLAAREAFFRDLFTELGPRGWIYVAVVERGEQLLAYELGWAGDDALWSYTRAFDPAEKQLSPGLLLSKVVIEHAARRHLAEYDLLRGQEEWKRRLGGEPRATRRADLWSDTLRSRVARLVYLRVRRAVMRAIARVGPWDIELVDL